jgi:hypothetical protein
MGSASTSLRPKTLYRVPVRSWAQYMFTTNPIPSVHTRQRWDPRDEGSHAYIDTNPGTCNAPRPDEVGTPPTGSQHQRWSSSIEFVIKHPVIVTSRFRVVVQGIGYIIHTTIANPIFSCHTLSVTRDPVIRHSRPLRKWHHEQCHGGVQTQRNACWEIRLEP